MRLMLFAAPAEEPVDLLEAKLQLRLGPDPHEDDTLIQGLIRLAREHVESVTNRALMAQTWDALYPCFPAVFEIPRPPLIEIVSVSYVDTSGATQVVGASVYQVQRSSGPWAERARVAPVYGQTWPITQPDTLEAVTVRFTAGYGTTKDTVPETLRQAMLHFISDHYDGCEPAAAVASRGLVSGLIAPYINRPEHC